MQKHQNGKKTNGTNVKRQNTKMIRYKQEKIKMRQKTKSNIIQTEQSTNVTKYKNNKIRNGKKRGKMKKDIIQTGQTTKLVLSADFLLESQAQNS